jgi:hypothetical protein
MIVILEPNIDKNGAAYQRLFAHLAALPNIQVRTHEERGAQQTLTELYLVGDTAALTLENITALPGVARVVAPDALLDVFHATAQGIIAGANMVLVDFHGTQCRAGGRPTSIAAGGISTFFGRRADRAQRLRTTLRACRLDDDFAWRLTA